MTTQFGYHAEQTLIVLVSSISFILALLQIRAQKESHQRVRPLHKQVHLALLLGSTLSLIWSTDPRGQHRIYPWYILGFMKDHMIVFLLYAASAWLTQCVRVILGVNFKPIPERLELYMSVIPVCFCWILLVVLDSVRVTMNWSGR